MNIIKIRKFRSRNNRIKLYKISDKLKVRMRFVLISFKTLRVLRVSRRETPFLLSVKKIGNFHLFPRKLVKSVIRLNLIGKKNIRKF